MQVNLTTIVGSLLLILFASNGIHALSCLMCNALMSSKGGACPEVGQYHSMTCRASTRACIKIDGNQTIVNQTSTGNPETKTIIGIQRNCGTPYNLQLFKSDPPVAGCKKVTVTGADLTARPNSDGTIPKYFFDGQICVCDSNNCNN